MKIALVILIGIFFPMQDDTIANIGAALKAGSAKELIKYCNNNVEIKIDGNSASYSLNQAEVVLKDFFLNSPPRSFTYVHQGSSPEGLQYSIGTYKMVTGSYRVVMVIKKVGDHLKIDTITFSRQ